VIIRVQDTGPGIAPKIAARVFEPFIRNGPKGTGSGLGLAICRRLVHEAAGEISLDTAYTEGCCVEVRLAAASPLSAIRPQEAA